MNRVDDEFQYALDSIKFMFNESKEASNNIETLQHILDSYDDLLKAFRKTTNRLATTCCLTGELNCDMCNVACRSAKTWAEWAFKDGE